MRYINVQPHSSACGPVAVLNVLKWLGKKVSYRKQLNKFRKIGWDMSKGTSPKLMSSMLKSYGIKYKVHSDIKYADLFTILDKKRSFIILYKWIMPEVEGEFHYGFVWGYTPQHFKAPNATCAKFRCILEELFTYNRKFIRKTPIVWEILS